jgi:hypothetical protein
MSGPVVAGYRDEQNNPVSLVFYKVSIWPRVYVLENLPSTNLPDFNSDREDIPMVTAMIGTGATPTSFTIAYDPPLDNANFNVPIFLDFEDIPMSTG